MRRVSYASCLWLLAAVMIVSLAGPTRAQQSAQESLPPRLIQQDARSLTSDLEKSIPALMKKGRVPGLQIALARDGKVIWHNSFGVKNAETGEPVTDDTIFEAASLTKPLFAYAVMRLVEQGVVDLDTPLITHFSDQEMEGFLGHPLDKEGFHREWAEVITARHVLSHSAGTPHGESGEVYPLFFEPGTKYKYSAAGYHWLQLVVAKLTGEATEATVQRLVLDPLGMKHSSMVWRDDYENAMANGHGVFGTPNAFRKYTEPHAAASLYTTAEDYAKFVCAVLNGDGLERETLEEMLTPQITVDEEMGLTWSLGFGLQQDANGKGFWQWGDYGIFRNYILAYPDKKVGVVYLTNSFNGLGIGREMIAETIGGQALGLAFLNYRQYDSPLAAFAWEVQDRGPEAVAELLPKLKAEHPDDFSVDIIGWLGGEFNDAGMSDRGIALLEFNVKDNPVSYGAHAGLARAYLEQGDRDKARGYYGKALEVAGNDEEFDSATVDWAMDYINALDNPAHPNSDFLQLLAGDYETRHFELRDGDLYYLRDGVESKEFRKLTPMTNDTFLIEGLIYFRLKFEFDKEGQPEKVVGLYEGGYRDESIRDKDDSRKRLTE
jgi:CubicO group peptidase (beta-lactamase class C family)